MLSQEQFDFIAKNINEDPRSLALKTHTSLKESMGFLLTQIKQKQRVNKKLPTWSTNPRLLFANDLCAEQCSSEITAEFKASLVEGKSMIDLTGGLGIDTIALSKKFEQVYYLETNKSLSEVSKHNFAELGLNNINILSENSIECLKQTNEVFDLILIDPDRRHNDVRVYDFENSEPNILEHLDLLLEKGKQVLIKGSPMLSIEQAVAQLKYVSKVWVVGHKNECKEILFLLEKESINTTIEAVELESNHQLRSLLTERTNDEGNYFVEPKTYLYDPFVAFRKAELVGLVNSKFNTEATQAPSISTSDELIKDFPGRCFKVKELIAPNSKVLKKMGITRANIISRANQLDANLLHKQLKLNAGGDIFLIALVQSKSKILLAVCEKVF